LQGSGNSDPELLSAGVVTLPIAKALPGGIKKQPAAIITKKSLSRCCCPKVGPNIGHNA
jgi:hypothetical protein